MKESLKQNWALVLAFALPIILIVGIAFSTYLPSLFLTTNYNFIYSICTDGVSYYTYNCNDYLEERYVVIEGKLAVDKKTKPTTDLSIGQESNANEKNYSSRIFLHDTENNISREITLEEAETLTLNGLITSPDGVTVSSDYERRGDFFPFFYNRSYGYYLTEGSSKSKLNLINDDDRYYYRDNFQFIGWVIPGRSN